MSGIAVHREILRMLRFVVPPSCDEGPNSATPEPDAFRTIPRTHAHMSPLLLRWSFIKEVRRAYQGSCICEQR